MTSRIPLHRALAGVLLLAASAATWAQSTLPSTLSLSKEPLLGVPPKHPNVVLALSVEFPTVSAAFNRITYVAGAKYVGYFNPSSCYLYDSDNNYFYPSGSTASDYTCTGKFSGNFLNWATMSSIDVFRYAMTGGYRVVDTTTQTILARTYLPNNETPSGGIVQPSNFYAHATYFPRRWVSTTESGNNGNIATVAPSSVTPFSFARMSVVNCRGDVLFGEWDSSGSPTCATPLRDGRFAADDSGTVRRYKVRVLVCDATEGPARGDFCGKYQNSGSPIYKPIGEMQKNADNMRFSVFGYVIDQSTTRYGGVMRTEMKYVGPNAYDATFRLTGTNTRAEWSTSTGIFTDNPDAASEGNSGVVNYLNKFGNLSGHEGVYKRYDPVGELYYEGLRYLMGKAPSTAALSGAPFSAGMKQGFPVVDWTNSADPLVCSSQPQYVIAIADTNAWGDKTIPGNTYTSENDTARAVEADGMNVLTWTRNVGLRAKADGLLPLTDGAISSSQADTLDTWVDGGRGNSFAMAGLAYWASTQDIRTDASKAVNTGKQTVTTITIDVAEPSALKPTERQLFLAGAYGGASDPHNPNWMLASNPDALIAALQNAFARVSSTSGSIGGGTITAGTYVAGDTGIFVPYFDTSTWFGELEHYAVSVDSSGNASIASTTSWKASEQIPVYDEVNGTTNRNIVLGSALGGGVSFEWANLSTSQQAQLNINPHTLTDDGNGEARVAYLRGSRADEGIDSTAFVGELPEGADGDASGAAKPFRVRTNILGDIVNSSPVYVGKPNSNISEALGPGYQAWSTDAARQDRTAMVYVAANDGMVHGFDVSNGAEVLAYIPSQMVAKLAKLTHPGYKHEPFVDGSLTSADAYANGAWRTVLAGAYGGGARGVFALDVTDPAAFSSTSVLWEFSAANDPDMGYVVGKVLIAPVKVGSTIKWFVVTASGYNNYGADGTGDNANGYLFLLALDKASGVAWQQNTNYYKIQIPLDTSSTAAMGLAQPGGVYNHLGVLTRMYAGDLRGNLWRVDLTSSTPSSWAVSAGSTPLFVATDANGNRQPITVAPAISYGPSRGYIVSFGTGRLLATGDTTARTPDATTTAFDGQSFYSVWDDLSTTISGRSSLASRSISSGALTGTSFTYGTGTGQKRGWYFDYPAGTNNGERTISPALLSYGRVFLNTVLPGADPCANGQSVTYVASVLQGTGTAYSSVVGYVATPLLMRSQLVVGTRDPTMYGNATLRTAVFNIGTDGRSVTMPGGQSVAVGSWTWRELLNWRELRR